MPRSSSLDPLSIEPENMAIDRMDEFMQKEDEDFNEEMENLEDWQKSKYGQQGDSYDPEKSTSPIYESMEDCYSTDKYLIGNAKQGESGKAQEEEIIHNGFNYGPYIKDKLGYVTNLGSKRQMHPSEQPAKRNKGKSTARILDHFDQPEECISTARDLLIKAAHLTDSRSKQTKILDLLNIFREYLEKDGNLPRDVSVLSSQLQRLEQTTQVLETTMKQTKVNNILSNKTTTQSREGNQGTKNAEGAQKQPQRPTQMTSKNPIPQINTEKKSWASIAGPSQVQEKSKGWTVISAKKKSMSSKPRTINRLILIQDPTTRQTLSPLQTRDKINQAFKARGVDGPVVATVSQTRKENIALTTTGPYSADFLLEKVDIWKNIAPHQLAMKDEPWYKVIIHGIPTTEFETIEDLSTISEEISTFNSGLKVIGQPYWITPEEKRRKQIAGSIVVAFETEEQARQAITRKLIVAGRSLKAEKYMNVPATTQCNHCQGYGHISTKCRWEAKCQFCAGQHNTQQHVCSQCNSIGKKCVHLIPKCANCGEAHTSEKETCAVRVSIVDRAAAHKEPTTRDESMESL
ncbi:hypothetical protein K3495_g13920 [Podosphaera aphanis]|nr:hypothetical protein K3495_g13920 [Podosphaera aphanis]